MLITWTYAPGKVLRVKIERAAPDIAVNVTVFANEEEGRQFDESQKQELLDYIRDTVAGFSA